MSKLAIAALLLAAVLSAHASQSQVFRRQLADDNVDPPAEASEPEGTFSFPTCTANVSGAVYTPFDACYCSCPTAFADTTEVGVNGSLAVDLPDATFSISGPDPLFGVQESHDELAQGGRRLLSDKDMPDLLPAEVLPILASVLQGGEISGLDIPESLISDVQVNLGLTPPTSQLPATLSSGLAAVLSGAYPNAAVTGVSQDIISAITTVLRAALPSGLVQIADSGEVPLLTQIQNAADSLTSNGLPQPAQPTSDQIGDAVKIILAIQGIKTITDPDTLPTVIADAITLAKDPKAAIKDVPADLLKAVKTIIDTPLDIGTDVIGALKAFLSKLDFPSKFLPTPKDVLAPAAATSVSKLLKTLTSNPDPFKNLIEAGSAELLVNALKIGIPANSSIFGPSFDGIPALPSPIADVLKIVLSSKVKVSTVQSASTLLQDFFESITKNGGVIDPTSDPISPSEFFAALQIFEALAIDQNLPFDFINAIQVFLNITVPEPLAKLDKTPVGLLPALPNPIDSLIQQYLVDPLMDNTFGFTLPPTTFDNLQGLQNLLAGILPAGLQNSTFVVGLEGFLNNTVGVPVQFVQNVTSNLLPPPPPPPRFPGINITNPLNLPGGGPAQVNGITPLSTAGPLTPNTPLPSVLVNSVQDLMLPGSLPDGTAPIPAPLKDSVRSLMDFILPGVVTNGTAPIVPGNMFNPDCVDGEEVDLEQCYCSCALVFDSA